VASQAVLEAPSKERAMPVGEVFLHGVWALSAFGTMFVVVKMLGGGH
jgi:hypothetical protein